MLFRIKYLNETLLDKRHGAFVYNLEQIIFLGVNLGARSGPEIACCVGGSNPLRDMFRY